MRPSELGTSVRRAWVLLLAGAFTCAPGTSREARAADPIRVPIAAGVRKADPLPAGDKIQLSLQQAIALALRNALDLDVSSMAYEKAAFGLKGSTGIFDPFATLDLTASRTQSPVFSSLQASDTKSSAADVGFGGRLFTGATYNASWRNSRRDSPVPGFTTINPTYSSTFSAGFTQPLLRGFGRTITERLIVQSRYGRDQAAWSFVNQLQSTIQAVENAYWDLVYAQENLKSRREALDRAKDLNRITKIKIDVGALAPIDIVQTEVTIAQREQEIIAAEGQIGNAEDLLKRLLNVTSSQDWSRSIEPTDRPSDEVITVDVESGFRRALETRVEVKQAVLDIESRKLSLVYNKDQIRPQLDLSASYSLGGLGARSRTADGRQLDCVDALYQIRSFEFPGWSVGLSLNVPIFNRTAKANASSAAVDLELARTNLALLKQNLSVEVRSAARGVDVAARSVAAARKSRELAERNLDAEKKKFENGMTTSFQVSQIQNDLTSASSGELLAIAGYRKAVTQWHKAIGDLLTEKGVVVEGLPVTLDPTPAEEGALK